MADMPRPRPPHLLRERNRHGTLVWYVRIGKGPRIRIKAAYGTPEFAQAYQAALRGDRKTEVKRPVVGSLKWLLDRYRETHHWSRLSSATRKQRENIFRPIIEQSGDKSFSAVTRKSIQAGLDRRAPTPFQAQHFLDAMRGLFVWAAEAGHITSDPTAGVKAVKPKTDGFRVWTEDEIGRFERHWPIGTRERLAFDLLLYTGLRRGDAVAIGRQHVKNGILSVRTAKTGQVVDLPVLQKLAASIAAAPTGDLTFIVGESGRPMVKEGFGNWFRQVCNAAAVPGSAHGLRKAAATRLADNGASEAQLEAVFGWRGGRMASLYTRAANRRKLAMDVMSKMAPQEQIDDIYPRTSQSGAGEADQKLNKNN